MATRADPHTKKNRSKSAETTPDGQADQGLFEAPDSEWEPLAPRGRNARILTNGQTYACADCGPAKVSGTLDEMKAHRELKHLVRPPGGARVDNSPVTRLATSVLGMPVAELLAMAQGAGATAILQQQLEDLEERRKTEVKALRDQIRQLERDLADYKRLVARGAAIFGMVPRPETNEEES